MNQGFDGKVVIFEFQVNMPYACRIVNFKRFSSHSPKNLMTHRASFHP